jgi:hypothetical protein
LLNGQPGKPINHARGLQQCDPLSPMLFILTMDPLQKLLDKATEAGLLFPIGASPVKMGTSLYADDAIMFLRPISMDVSNLQHLINQFGKATGLCTNFIKSEVFLIRCEGINIPQVLDDFQAKRGEFPCKYLRLPIRIGLIRRAYVQVLIDKVAGKLHKWKGRLLNKPGRLTLVNSVLSVVVLYHMSVFQLSKWAIKRIDKIRHSFLWQGSDNVRGGHCLVN